MASRSGSWAQANRSVIDLSGDLAAAQLVGQARTKLVSGAADFRAKFMADRAAKQERPRGPPKDNDGPDYNLGL